MARLPLGPFPSALTQAWAGYTALLAVLAVARERGELHELALQLEAGADDAFRPQAKVVAETTDGFRLRGAAATLLRKPSSSWPPAGLPSSVSTASSR